MSGRWLPREQDPRSYDNPVDEREVYVEYLRNYRLTLELKCDGLDAEQLARRSVPPSPMSLLGLVRHMALVEYYWFQRVIGGRTERHRFDEQREDRDADFNGAIADDAVVSDAFDRWRAEIAASEAMLAAQPDLGAVISTGRFADDPVSLRDIMVHMIEEYARHCGHADLLRECIDGRTGQ